MRARYSAPLIALAGLAVAPAAARPPERLAPRIQTPAPALRAEPIPEPLRVRLYDPYRLLTPEAEDLVRKETSLAFARSGVGLRFTRRGGPTVIPATLYPELPDRWDLAPETIGVAIGVHGGRRSVFLSLGAAERALGLRPARSKRLREGDARPRRKQKAQPRRLGIALGRVLAHELTHTIAPDCPHTASGLMAETLSRRMLTAPGIGFDPLATRHLREAAARRTASAPESG